MKKDWLRYALCSKDKRKMAWYSYNLDDIEYAKNICKKCEVRQECLFNALKDKDFYGVNAGISEYEFKMLTWKKVDNVDESNWSRSRNTLQRVLREAQ